MAILKKRYDNLNNEKKIKNGIFNFKNILKNIYAPRPKK